VHCCLMYTYHRSRHTFLQSTLQTFRRSLLLDRHISSHKLHSIGRINLCWIRTASDTDEVLKRPQGASRKPGIVFTRPRTSSRTAWESFEQCRAPPLTVVTRGCSQAGMFSGGWGSSVEGMSVEASPSVPSSPVCLSEQVGEILIVDASKPSSSEASTHAAFATLLDFLLRPTCTDATVHLQQKFCWSHLEQS
jgi:hypothetical protein